MKILLIPKSQKSFNPPIIGQNHINHYNISGTTSAGGVQTIRIPAVAFTPAGPAAGIVSPGAFAILHSARIDVTEASATFQSASFQMNGTFQESDLGRAYDRNGDGIADEVEGIYLVYHKTPNLTDVIYGEEEGEDNVSLLSYTETIPNAGETLTFRTTIKDEFNPTIPLGTGYISVATLLRETAVPGRTIQASTSGATAYSLVSGNISGTTGTGGMQTIGVPSITISAVPTPAANIPIGAGNTVLYKIRLDVANAAAVLKSLSLTTGGTYQEDVYSFVLYHSTDAEFDKSDNSVGYASHVPSGGKIEFNDFDYFQLRPGSSSYLLLVAQSSADASAVGRTINIAATPASALTFVTGIQNGSFPLPAGGVQTFVGPTLQVTMPPLTQQNLSGGTNNNVIHRFNVTAAGADAFPQYFGVTGHGTFDPSDIGVNGFKLWFNTTDSFIGSRIIATMNGFVYGGFNPDFHAGAIKAGTTGYYFITADIAPTAQEGNTLQLEITYLYFASGEAALPGNSRSPLHTIKQAATTVPALTVTYSPLASSVLQKGTADNVIYQFNVAASDANTLLNYIKFHTSGNFRSSDLAENELKLWHNTTNSFDGSTLVQSFATDFIDGYSTGAALGNVQINAGTTGHFFITASISPNAVSNRKIRIEGLESLQFASGTAGMTWHRGAEFSIGSILSITAVPDNNYTHVYPNPYRQHETLIIVTSSAHPKLVTIYSATGKVVRSMEMTETTQLVLSNLSKGLYLIQVQHLKDNKVEVKKLLVQ